MCVLQVIRYNIWIMRFFMLDIFSMLSLRLKIVLARWCYDGETATPLFH